ncbi:MAG: undecaprenyl diphosphate synthase family protein, partial [Deltaproteobacteria bacterium]|nr:undecaprenyl diphosphate synthase family protein [Deltaproteobacteria bacterium]
LSYAEIYFTDTMWPDYRKSQFLEAIKAFGNRQRRFGRTGDQLSSK